MADQHRRHGRPEPQYEQVARNFRNRIHAGRLTDGEALPSSRDLAAEWGVSVFTISEAMKVLAREGLVVSKSRSSRVVRYPEGRTRRPDRPRRPQAVLVGGWPGSGKSELGRILSRQTGWAFLDKDTMTRPIMEATLELLGQSPWDRESQTYRDSVRPRQYDALIATMLENLECGASCLAVAPFTVEFADPAWIDRTLAQIIARGADARVVWVTCDLPTMHGYLRHRGAARDAAKLANWSDYSAGIDPDFRPPVDHVLVDNSSASSPLQDQAGRILATFVGAAS